MQEFGHGICRKYGWSARFFKISDDGPDVARRGCWAVEVCMGLGRQKTFISTDRSNDSIKYRKQGKKAAALVALEGLKEDVQREMNKPIVHGLDGAVRDLFAGTQIVESSPSVWNGFWKNPPDAVGVDTEGNSLTPPVLVQIATDDIVILEVPTSDGLSANLQRLLKDDTIIKVLCDSSSRKDAISLGLPIQDYAAESSHNIVDLEKLASDRMGVVSSHRGLSNLLCLTMPELGVRICKESAVDRINNVATFTAIEQGYRPRLLGFHDLTPEERTYAAVDAWATLQIWRRLKLDSTRY